MRRWRYNRAISDRAASDRAMIETAMILAAGKGTRMRAAPDAPPKPLTEIAGRSLLARMLARCENAGIKKIIINVHHKAAHIEHALSDYDGPCEIVFSDERDGLLETGGGVKKALPLLGEAPFLVANGDVLWHEANHKDSAMEKFCAAFDGAQMDALLMLTPTDAATGYDGKGDYHADDRGRLTRRRGTTAPFVFAGVQVLTPGLFAAMPDGAFSLNKIYDAAAATQRLFGHELAAQWMHVGTPEGRSQAENLLTRL